jgi:ABC-type Na+ efflux pump permease subunit
MTGYNWRAMRAIIRKDLMVVLRSPMVLVPMIILPLILQVLMPVGFGLVANFAQEEFANETEDLDAFFDSMPPAVAEQIEQYEEAGQFLVLSLVYLFAPLYLIVPMMVASVIAADSFVGERERKTMEALLYTPLSNRELLLAKMLTAWLAAMVVSVGSFILYVIIADAVTYPFVGRLLLPNALWLVLIFWVVPAVAAFGLMVTVLISSRVKTFQEAYQFGGVIVIPIVGLLLAQISGFVFFGPVLALVFGAVVWFVNVLMYLIGADTFKREVLIARL